MRFLRLYQHIFSNSQCAEGGPRCCVGQDVEEARLATTAGPVGDMFMTEAFKIFQPGISLCLIDPSNGIDALPRDVEVP